MRDASRRRCAPPPFGWGALLLVALGLSSLGAGCSTNTAGLERRDPGDGASGAGADSGPGAGGDPSGGAGSEGGAGGAANLPGELESGAIEIVHGIVDGGALFVCLRDAVSGEPLFGDAPEPSEGVPYGRGWSLSMARWDVATGDVELELFVAVPELVPASCSALRSQSASAGPLPAASDAGAPDAGPVPELPFPLEPEVPRRAGALRLSPGVVRADGHYALVAAGCTGPGDGADDVCGPADGLFGERQTLVLAEIADQVSPRVDAFGLQFLNASRALPRADLVLQWESQRQSLRVSSDVGFAAVRPRDAASVDDEPVGLELHVRGEALSSFTQSWSDTVQASSAGTFTAGGNYLVVYVGPLPGAASSGVNPPRFVLIRGRSARDGDPLAQ